MTSQEFLQRLFYGKRPRSDVRPEPMNIPKPVSREGATTDQLLNGEWINIRLHVKRGSGEGAMAYDDARKMLFVRYPDGAVYAYDPVTQYEATSMLYSGSKGSWIWSNLRLRGTLRGHQKRYAKISDPGRIRLQKHTHRPYVPYEHIPPVDLEFPGWNPLVMENAP
jgi:hypothetical protein